MISNPVVLPFYSAQVSVSLHRERCAYHNTQLISALFITECLFCHSKY